LKQWFTYIEGYEVELQSFLTSTQAGGERSASGPSTLPLGKEPQHPLYRRLSGPKRQSGCLEEGKNLLSLLGVEPMSYSGYRCSIIALHLHVSQVYI